MGCWCVGAGGYPLSLAVLKFGYDLLGGSVEYGGVEGVNCEGVKFAVGLKLAVGLNRC
jgi:hypothetical protein